PRQARALLTRNTGSRELPPAPSASVSFLWLGLSSRSVCPLRLHPLAVVPVPSDGCLLKKGIFNALMIDQRRPRSAICAVMAEDEFSVHRRVHRPALPGVDAEPIIRGLSNLIGAPVVVVSEY